MSINHSLIADGDPLIDGDDWNANHTITDMFGYTLLSEQKVSNVSSINFNSLTSSFGTEFLLEYLLIGSTTTPIILTINGDTTSKNYVIYQQLQETDGNTIHLTNWDSTRTISRIYLQTPYITVGKTIIHDLNSGTEGRATHRSEFNMFRAGWGESGGYWYKATESGVISSISLTFSGTVSGNVKLWAKMTTDTL